MRRPSRGLSHDRGSSPVEFVLVAGLLTLLTLGVLQFGLVVYVRNVAHDAAVEGAYRGALADQTPADGADRTRDIIDRTIGPAYAGDVRARRTARGGLDVVEVTVRTPVPLIGLVGVPRMLEVHGVAPAESFD